MTLPSTQSLSYTRTAKLLHWLIALLIIGMLALGWTMGKVSDMSLKFSLFQLHKSIGITILLLSLIRLGWRLTHTAPPLPTGMPLWEKAAAHITHTLFYILIIGMPLTGWIMVSSSTRGIPTMLYGLVQLPNLPYFSTLPNKGDVGHSFGWLHGNLAFLLAGLIVLHIGAAWKHHLFNRDDVLTRMAPRFLHPILNRIRGH
jgi:cytochrome b561